MSLGLDRSHYSQALLAKVTYAGSNNKSYEQAARDLQQLAEIAMSDKQVRRICKAVGKERVAERHAEVAAYQRLPLTERKGVPQGVSVPPVAVVGVDGGRLQIFERPPAKARPEPAGTAPPLVSQAAATPAEETPVDDGQEHGKHWREDKIGLLMTMSSTVSEHDPCPLIPEAFVSPLWIPRLARELKKRAPAQEEAVGETVEPEAGDQALSGNPTRWEPPERLARRLLATRRPWAEFAPMVAWAAWQEGFFGAPRRAFLGDGADNNWTLWRTCFSSFVPILDFIHALSYVFASAMAGQSFKEGWPVYERWIRWLWSGAVEQVIAELAVRQAELGVPAADDSDSSPRQVVAKALTYLQNHKERMRYAEYRRQGLPITSSYVESAVKEFNYRVKGTEKFWNEAGAEEILQLRADYLSDGDVMQAFWQRREARMTGQRPYRQAA
jgi:hypothetical protein